MATKKQQLHDFIVRASAAGLTEVQQRKLLVEAGWAEAKVDGAFRRIMVAKPGVAVPRPTIIDSPGSWALSGFYFLLIYLIFYNFVDLCFDLIDYFVDTAPRYLLSTIRWNLSILLAASAFLGGADWLLQRRWLDSGPTRLRLTYITLFLAGCTVLGSLSTIIYALLSQEGQMAAFLKALFLMIFSAMVFAYFVLQVKKLKAQDDD